MPEFVRLPDGTLQPLPAPQPEPEPESVDEAPDEEREEQSGGRWDWIGSPSRPEAKESSDGISDLFRVTDEDVGAGADVDDLVEVDMERDVIDADDDGTLDDLVNVTDDDIMGDEDFGQPPPRQPRYRAPRPKRTTRLFREPPPSMRGLRG